MSIREKEKKKKKKKLDSHRAQLGEANVMNEGPQIQIAAQ
jgi:hypothetical protein